jgi:hypothetical protein
MGRRLRDADAIERHFALEGDKSVDAAEQRRLAAAGRPDQRADLRFETRRSSVRDGY